MSYIFYWIQTTTLKPVPGKMDENFWYSATNNKQVKKNILYEKKLTPLEEFLSLSELAKRYPCPAAKQEDLQEQPHELPNNGEKETLPKKSKEEEE